MKMLKMKKNRKRGFSLVELMIVMAIIALLSVVLIPSFQFAPQKAEIAGVITDFRSFEIAVKSTHIATGALPTTTDLERDLVEFGITTFEDGTDDDKVATITDDGGQEYTVSVKDDGSEILFTATHITPDSPTLKIDSTGKVTTTNTGTARDE